MRGTISRHRVPLCARKQSRAASTQTQAPTQADTQLASALAGIASRVLLHPVDCIKTRLQHLRGRQSSINASKVISEFISQEGIAGLYRGIVTSLVGVVPYSMLYMPSYEFAQQQLGRRLGDEEWLGLRHVLAGSIAGFCGSLVKVPMDVVKKRLQAGLYANIGAAVNAIAQERRGLNRVIAFYAGWKSAILYDVPYNAVQFTVLENTKRIAGGWIGGNVMIGAVTGMITSIITEPLDVVKTRMMTQARGGGTLYKGWLHCFRCMVREEGAMALWKGTLPRLVWVGASSAIWYGVYQTARQGMTQRRMLHNEKEKRI